MIQPVAFLGNTNMGNYTSNGVNTTMNVNSIAPQGSSSAFSIMNPYITLNYIIKY